MTPIKESHSECFLKKVEETVQMYQMLTYGDTVLVGLSGGADSVALLFSLLQLREKYDLQIACAHVNHQLRGEAAQRDMQFVTELCNRLKLKLYILEEDVAQYAKEKCLSLEEAGREVRYAFFSRCNTTKIATAHHKNDNAETVLINFIRGNLPLGISPVRDNIIRPLIGVSKEEICAYLKEQQEAYVTDETNFSSDYLRNRIRLELIPYLEEKFNNNFTNTVYNTSEILFEEQNFLEETAENFLNRFTISTEKTVKLPLFEFLTLPKAIARRVIRCCYYRLSEQKGRISYEQIHRVSDLAKQGVSGRRIPLSQNIEALLSGETLVFTIKTVVGEYCYELTPEEPLFLEETGCQFLVTQTRPETYSGCYTMFCDSVPKVFVRNRRNGDKIFIKSIGGHKKISDFMIDKKIPLIERERIPLIVVNGEIRVIVGYFSEQQTASDGQNLWYLVKNEQSI